MKYAGISVTTVIATLVIIAILNRQKEARRALGTEDTFNT